MKKLISILLIAAMLTSALPLLAAAEGDAVVLPETLTEIREETFAGNASIRSVVIPKTVNRIGAKAFSNCTGLEEVYFGKNAEIDIAADAFDGCGDIHCYAFPNTKAELYALSHGYVCDSLEEQSTFLQKAMDLVAAHGGTSTILQSGEFAAMRLIVRMKGDRLPDISEYAPIEILQAGDGVFFIQFDDVQNTSKCYTALLSDARVDFIEPDACVDVIDEVEAAGTVYDKVWDTDDPMGFDKYAPFVAENGTKRVTIAVIDSGVEKKNAYIDILRRDGISLISGEPDWSVDSMRHGSMITGIIKDCIGKASVDVLPIRVVSKNGLANLTMIALAIQYALEHGADVINMSLNFENNDYITYWLNRAMNDGVTVVVAAGNNSRNIAKVFPANVPGVVTVSGIDSDYELSSGSNYGDNVSYCAPDTDVICSAYNGTRTGTSFAAPMVAAAMALVKSDPYHGETDLRTSCRKLVDAVGNQNNYGYGLMQLAKLATISVTSVKIDEETPEKMAVGKSFALKWTLLPEKATAKHLSVESSNPDALEVTHDDEGNYTLNAVGRGVATVTVDVTEEEEGAEKVFDTHSVTVVQPVTDITITAPKTRLALNRTLKVTASSIMPESADNKEIEWQLTSAGGKAKISAGGVITPIATGRISVVAHALDGYDAVSNTLDIDIIHMPDPESVVISEKNGVDVSSGSVLVVPGDNLDLAAAVEPEDADQSVEWSCESEPEGAVTVDQDGHVEAIASGTATVTATADNGVSAQLEIDVAILPTAISIKPDTSDGAAIVNTRETIGLTVSFTPEEATARDVVFTSMDSQIAQVDQNGIVTGVSKGKTSIVVRSAAADTVSSSIEVTVRQPYTLNFNANEGNLTQTSKIAYSGYAVGTLPTPQRDYYNFDGWYSQASGGDRITEASVIEASDSCTIYAHWTLKPESNWVVASSVPTGAMITDRKTETTTSTSSSLSGWTNTGNRWKQTGSGSVNYASFPGGFDTGNWIYQNFSKSALSSYDNGSTKRTVSNEWAGYVYWHWMYDTSWSNGTSGRAIYHQYGYGPDNGFLYKYFGAFTSTNGNYSNDLYYCNSQSIRNYIVPERTSWDDCQGATRWFRFDYYVSRYTDYQKEYTFSRELVKYREK